MGRLAAKYSDQQKDAIVGAVLDQGLSAREATVKAAAGELEPPPFEMPVSTAQTIVTDAKGRGRVADNKDRLHKLVDDVLTAVEAQMDKLLESAQTGQLNARDATLGRRLTQMAGHAAYLNNTLARETPEPEPSPQHSSRLLERMMDDLETRQPANDTTPEPAPSGDTPPTEREQLLRGLHGTAANGAAS